MAEYCLRCYLKYCKPDDIETAAIRMSEAAELCEGCGDFKQIVEEVAEPPRADRDQTRGGITRRFLEWFER